MTVSWTATGAAGCTTVLTELTTGAACWTVVTEPPELNPLPELNPEAEALPAEEEKPELLLDSTAAAAAGLEGDSIENFQLEVWLKITLEIWLEIPCAKKMFKRW